MEIILFVLGVVFIIIGLPICFSCEIRAYLDKKSKNKNEQIEHSTYHTRKRDRGIGLILMLIGFIVIILSFAVIVKWKGFAFQPQLWQKS